jgi:hypothetical protein
MEVLKMLRKVTFICLAGLLVLTALSGCSFGSKSLHIEWATGGRAMDIRGLSGTYIGYVPYGASSFVATCKDAAELPVASLWSLNQPLMGIRGAFGEDPAVTPLDSIVCEPAVMGDCNLTATNGTETATVRVRILGNLELNWPEGPATVYFKLRKSGAAQVSTIEEADVVLTSTSATSFAISCPGGKGIGYPTLQGFSWQYDFVPNSSEINQTDLGENMYAFGLINADNDVVTVAIEGYLPYRSQVRYFFH